MSNVVNPEVARAFARKVSVRVDDPIVARRFEKLAFLHLIGDARNLRPVEPNEWAALPAWADKARVRGDALHVFALHRGSAQRVQIAARRLADACAVATADVGALDSRHEAVRAARKFIAKISRMSFDATSRKAYGFSVLRRTWAEERDHEQLCENATVIATNERIWRRVTSLGELRGVGREFRNCLASTTRRSPYGAALVRGDGQFWVLRDRAGAGSVIAFATCSAPVRFREVKGPRNAPIRGDHLDLLALAAALGIKPRDPPAPPPSTPPQPPSSATALRVFIGESEVLLARRAHLLQHLAAPLRRDAAGH